MSWDICLIIWKCVKRLVYRCFIVQPFTVGNMKFLIIHITYMWHENVGKINIYLNIFYIIH